MIPAPRYLGPRPPPPGTGDWTLQVIHDGLLIAMGQRCRYSTTQWAKARYVDCIAAQGWEPVVAPRWNSFSVARNLDPAHEIKPYDGPLGPPRPLARSGYPWTAVDEFGPVIDDIYDFAELRRAQRRTPRRRRGPAGRDQTDPRAPCASGRTKLVLFQTF